MRHLQVPIAHTNVTRITDAASAIFICRLPLRVAAHGGTQHERRRVLARLDRARRAEACKHFFEISSSAFFHTPPSIMTRILARERREFDPGEPVASANHAAFAEDPEQQQPLPLSHRLHGRRRSRCGDASPAHGVCGSEPQPLADPNAVAGVARGFQDSAASRQARDRPKTSRCTLQQQSPRKQCHPAFVGWDGQVSRGCCTASWRQVSLLEVSLKAIEQSSTSSPATRTHGGSRSLQLASSAAPEIPIPYKGHVK